MLAFVLLFVVAHLSMAYLVVVPIALGRARRSDDPAVVRWAERAAFWYFATRYAARFVALPLALAGWAQDTPLVGAFLALALVNVVVTPLYARDVVRSARG